MLPMQTKSILFFIPRVILLGCKDSIFAAAAEGLRDDTVQIRCLTAAVRRRISYPFPEVFIYPLRRRFQIVIFAHFRVLSFALPRFSPFPVCFSYPSFIAPLRLYFCPFRGAVFLWWQVLFSVALPADL